ncbi:hypothetical protein BDV12DRAFT_167793 [Aspergillus spectabilis]
MFLVIVNSTPEGSTKAGATSDVRASLQEHLDNFQMAFPRGYLKPREPALAAVSVEAPSE